MEEPVLAKTWRVVVAAWAVAAASVPSGRTEPASPDIPTVVKAEAAPEWDAKFAGKEGWIGGDGAYSVVLGPKCVLWLFGDSLLGTAKDGKRAGAVMVNNTVAVQAGLEKDAAIRFVAGKGKDDKPAAIFSPADGKGWFWVQAAVRVGDRLFVFLPQIEKTKDGGAFGFKQVGQWLAVVENPDDDPEKWRVKQQKLPFTEFGTNRQRSWGSALLADGDCLYVYGYDEERAKAVSQRKLTVARVSAEKLGDWAAWRFRTSDGWSEKPADAAPLADGLATEFSVGRTPGGKGYVAVYTEKGLGDRVVGRFANAPEGPWSDAVLLYKCPEMAKDKGVFCYAAKAHPWAAADKGLVISYCVNTWEFARLFREEEVYRPKFVRVQLGPIEPRRSSGNPPAG
jgi:Domain of unknown function (DUF4185)